MRKILLFFVLVLLLPPIEGQSISNKNIINLLLKKPDKELDVITCDYDWEKKFDYATILKTDTCYVMYYRASNSKQYPYLSYCRAVSKDGIHWDKQNLGKILFDGSAENNIFSDKIDGVSVEYLNGVYWLIADRQYGNNKQKRGLALFRSHDGINFERYAKFDVPYFCDSQNVILWDETTHTYKLYLRSWYKSNKPLIDYHHTHQCYRTVSLLETPTLDYSLPVSSSAWYLAGKSEPPALNKELPVVIENRSLSEDFDIYCSYVNKYRDNLYIAYPINYYHTDDKKRGGKSDNDGYATIGFWTSKDGRKFDEIKRDYISGGKTWIEFCVGHIETDEMFIHYYINYSGTHGTSSKKNTIKARIHYKKHKK